LKFAFIIFKYFPFGGMQRDMLRTANELIKRGHSVEVFTLSWQGEAPNGMAVHVLPQKGWFNYQRYKKFISSTFKIIQATQVDYIFGYNRMAGLDAYFAADPCFIERAHTQRSFFYRLAPRTRWFANCEKAIFSATSNTHILAVALTEKPHFQKWYGLQDERFHYIPPYLSPERFVLENKTKMRKYLRQTFGFGAEDFVYLLTGSGFSMKGLDRAILALAAMPAELRANTRLVAVGQDNPKQFAAMAQQLGLQAHVVISKGRTDIPQLMQGADVCVHPAYRENTGLVILEAMACGTPLLVTETCGYAAHVKAADAGLVSASPYSQDQFNAEWLSMRDVLAKGIKKKPAWAKNGLAYIQQIMRDNDGSAEASILIQLAEEKVAKKADG
jgi:UDP-glucose:(heptosyl)LPS alpha-1,3-glucosyltransferase